MKTPYIKDDVLSRHRNRNLKTMKTQSKAQHTPGNWEFNDSTWEIWNPETLDYIAEVKRNTDDEEAKLNARLLAAAPELLEALQFAVKYHNMNEKNKFPTQLIGAIQKAIAKATGK